MKRIKATSADVFEYVKAHEDFLGGNTVSTNKEVKFIPEYYTTNINTSNASGLSSK